MLGSCSAAGDEAAATIGGETISRESVSEELDAITADPAYLAGVEQQFQTPAGGSGEGTYDATFVARLLTLRVYYELVEQELAERGVEITEEDRSAARELVVEGVGGTEAFESFPTAYQERLVHQRALLAAIEEEFSGEGREEGDAERYYQENQDQFETRCLAHILVGTNDEAQPTGELDREEAAVRAQELYEELQAGADFTELASGKANDDTVSAAQGGSLDCVTRETSFDPTFLEAAFDAEVGEVTEPVETQFGYHLILVSSAEVPPFEEVEQQVEQRLSSDAAGLFDEFLRSATCGTDIEVAERYGSWDTSQCEAGGIGAVVPPEGPTTTTTPTPGLAPEGADPAAPGSGAGG